VQSKLAYVDESILKAGAASDGSRTTFELGAPARGKQRKKQEEKVQRVATAMVQGAFKPKIQILEDRLERPLPYSAAGKYSRRRPVLSASGRSLRG
jgi:hypothetical protein